MGSEPIKLPGVDNPLMSLEKNLANYQDVKKLSDTVLFSYYKYWVHLDSMKKKTYKKNHWLQSHHGRYYHYLIPRQGSIYQYPSSRFGRQWCKSLPESCTQHC